MKKCTKSCALLLAGLAGSFPSASGPLLLSVQPDGPGRILVTVDWGNMLSDPGRRSNRFPCAAGHCDQQHINLIANINGRDEEFPRLTTRMTSATTSEADALRLLLQASKAGVARYRIPVPVTSDLCFKYTLGNTFEAHSFAKPNCIAQSLLSTTGGSR